MATATPPAAPAPADERETYDRKDEAYFSYYAMLTHQAQMLQVRVALTSGCGADVRVPSVAAAAQLVALSRYVFAR